MSVADSLDAILTDLDLEFERATPTSFVIVLPGENKLKTTVSLAVGSQSLSVNAFVARCPEENVAEVHRWLLERNRRMSFVAFSIDRLGDIYLVGKLPLCTVTAEGIDHVLGAVLEYADESFNPILGLGFRTAIQREWQWRTQRGESTANLEPFRNLIPESDDPAE
jgi:hypothetical protein